MDSTEKGGIRKEGRTPPKIPWKCLTIIFMCLSNFVLTFVLWTLVIPLREEINTLRVRGVQFSDSSSDVVVENGGRPAVEFSEDVLLQTLVPASMDQSDDAVANRTRRSKSGKKRCKGRIYMYE
jgi:hypothetical protein